MQDEREAFGEHAIAAAPRIRSGVRSPAAVASMANRSESVHGGAARDLAALDVVCRLNQGVQRTAKLEGLAGPGTSDLRLQRSGFHGELDRSDADATGRRKRFDRSVSNLIGRCRDDDLGLRGERAGKDGAADGGHNRDR